jgi:PAP2 superfamily
LITAECGQQNAVELAMSQSLTLKSEVEQVGFFAALLRYAFPHGSLWLMTLVMAVVNFAIAGLSQRISLDPLYLTILQLFYGFALLLMLARWARPQLFDWFLHRAWAALLTLLLMISFTTNLAVLHFITMAQQWPYADDMLIGADRALGFDWLAYCKFMTDNETLRAYLHFFYQEVTRKGMFVLPLVALLLNQRIRVYETLFMIFVTGVVVVLAAGFFPAIEPWTLLADDELLSRIKWTAAADHVAVLSYLRNDGPVLIDLSKLVGLATFPSYHTCLALCFTIALRGYRGLDVLGVICSVSIIAATPIFGAHYLMDLLSGGAITATSFLVWKAFVLPALAKKLTAQGDDAFDFPQAIMNLRIPGSVAKRQA